MIRLHDHVQALSSGQGAQEVASHFPHTVELPSHFAHWQKLERMDVSDNQLRSLPPELGACQALVSLQADRNRLESLPAELASATKLVELHVSGNRLTKAGVPGAIFSGCAALQTLDIHANPLTAEDLRELPGWQEFDERRRKKHDKKIQTQVMGSGFDEGADTRTVRHWK